MRDFYCRRDGIQPADPIFLKGIDCRLHVTSGTPSCRDRPCERAERGPGCPQPGLSGQSIIQAGQATLIAARIRRASRCRFGMREVTSSGIISSGVVWGAPLLPFFSVQDRFFWRVPSGGRHSPAPSSDSRPQDSTEPGNRRATGHDRW